MESIQKRRRRFFAALGLILALIITGIVMVGRVFTKYEDIILASEDE